MTDQPALLASVTVHPDNDNPGKLTITSASSLDRTQFAGILRTLADQYEHDEPAPEDPA
jgi:hypothetical protein